MPDQRAILEHNIDQKIVTIYAVSPQPLPSKALHILWTPLDAMLQLLLTSEQQWVAHQKKQVHKYGTYLVEQCFMDHWAIWR